LAKEKKKAGKKAKTKSAAKSSKATKSKIAATAKSSLKAMKDNPVVADIVAASLVAAAAALKDTAKARKLAARAGDEVEALAKEGAEKGNALWKLALDVGRRALDEFADKPAPKKRTRTKKS